MGGAEEGGEDERTLGCRLLKEEEEKRERPRERERERYEEEEEEEERRRKGRGGGRGREVGGFRTKEEWCRGKLDRAKRGMNEVTNW